MASILEQQASTKAEAGPRQCPYQLPGPASIVTYDFRPRDRQAPDSTRPIKLLQWNIERGYKLDAVIEELKALDADVLALQEIDIHCERSAYEASAWSLHSYGYALSLCHSHTHTCKDARASRQAGLIFCQSAKHQMHLLGPAGYRQAHCRGAAAQLRVCV